MPSIIRAWNNEFTAKSVIRPAVSVNRNRSWSWSWSWWRKLSVLWENFTKICIFMIKKIKMSRLPVFLLSVRDKFVAISRISFFGEIVLCNRAFSVSTRKNMAASGPTAWFQTLVNIKPKSRGVHIITDEIESIPELKKYKIGLAHLLLQHTSASICVNECWDSSVRKDMEMMLNRLVPESGPPYKHTIEGPDDMPG